MFEYAFCLAFVVVPFVLLHNRSRYLIQLCFRTPFYFHIFSLLRAYRSVQVALVRLASSHRGEEEEEEEEEGFHLNRFKTSFASSFLPCSSKYLGLSINKHMDKINNARAKGITTSIIFRHCGRSKASSSAA